MEPPSHARPPPPWAVPLAVTLLVVFGAGAFMTLAITALMAKQSHYTHSRVDSASADAQSVRSAAMLYVSENPAGPCPKVEALIGDGYLAASRYVTDAWGGRFAVECPGDDVEVFSAGADGLFGTADDVR